MDESKRKRNRRTDSGGHVAPSAYTIVEFCVAHRISRALFYIMARDGRGPRTFTCGRRRLVSVEAAAEWRRASEAGAA